MELRRALPEDSVTLSRLASCMFSTDAEELVDDFTKLTASDEAACFLAVEEERAIGFAQCQLRHDYVEGCSTSPVGFLEGIYVEPSARHLGVARALLRTCEDWARESGCTEFASDCELDNTASLAWHLHAGFTETNRTIWFAKKL
ncbi:MAG: GNAT family N-acetyltransferase [Clostridiales bacterium]|nr:GNAT family N-acetyltransferase [Clostridiales bacterium]